MELLKVDHTKPELLDINKEHLIRYEGNWAVRTIFQDSHLGYYVQPVVKGFPVINVTFLEAMYLLP